MRKDFGAREWCYPQQVFIIGTYDENEDPDAMNAAWGGIGNDKELFICLASEHKTTANILARKDFTVSMGTVGALVACDFVGIVSGNDTPDKMARSGWTVEKAPHVNAPLFAELPMTIECRLKSYDPETCHLFAEIVNVCADESVLTDGRIDPAKLQPITFDPVNLQYLPLGTSVGPAFKAGRAL